MILGVALRLKKSRAFVLPQKRTAIVISLSGDIHKAVAEMII